MGKCKKCAKMERVNKEVKRIYEVDEIDELVKEHEDLSFKEIVKSMSGEDSFQEEKRRVDLILDNISEIQKNLNYIALSHEERKDAKFLLVEKIQDFLKEITKKVEFLKNFKICEVKND